MATETDMDPVGGTRPVTRRTLVIRRADNGFIVEDRLLDELLVIQREDELRTVHALFWEIAGRLGAIDERGSDHRAVSLVVPGEDWYRENGDICPRELVRRDVRAGGDRWTCGCGRAFSPDPQPVEDPPEA